MGSVVRHSWLVAGFAFALPLTAQDRGKESPASGIPASAWPPAGLCRVWLRDVPASQQPAATDCATAIRNRPNNAQVLFGEIPGVAARGATTTMPARTGVQRQAELPSRATGPARTFVPAVGAPALTPGRGPDPTGARSSTVRTTGTPVRVPDTPPAKVPEKPREIPQP